MTNPKTIAEYIVVPVTVKISYEDRPGARKDMMRSVRTLFDGDGIYGASVYGGYSLEVASVGNPRKSRRTK